MVKLKLIIKIGSGWRMHGGGGDVTQRRLAAGRGLGATTISAEIDSENIPFLFNKRAQKIEILYNKTEISRMMR